MYSMNTRKLVLKEKGITLIALVVSVIILLILAGVTLNLVLGNQGLLGKSQLASNTMAEATRNEMAMMNEYEGTIDEETAMKLPSEFQRVEYLESTGTQYIDTKSPVYSKTKIFMKFLLTSNANDQKFLRKLWRNGDLFRMFRRKVENGNRRLD